MPSVSINISKAGTQLPNGSTSVAGHVWYTINDGQSKTLDFGFAAKHSKPVFTRSR
jgi:hypothetical protein